LPQTEQPNAALLQRLWAKRAHFLRFAQKRLGSRVEAEDAFQSALERAARHGGALRQEKALEAWFFQIVRREVETLRSKRNREPVHAKDPAPLMNELTPDSANPWGAQATATQPEDSCDCALAALKTLKPDQADILRAIDVAENTIQETAGRLKLSKNATTVRLHRARRALRDRVFAQCATTSEAECQDCSC